MRSTTYLRHALAAVLLSLFFTATAQAACEWSNRIALDDAECLEGGWTNQTAPKHDTAWVQSSCSAYGKVVAKIDREAATDWTVELTDATRAHRSGTAGNVRGIHCCSDLSDLCNKADVINAEGCAAQFEQSPASTTRTGAGENVCTLISATADAANAECTIQATCLYYIVQSNGQTGTAWQTSSLTVKYLEVPEISRCRGSGQLARNENATC